MVLCTMYARLARVCAPCPALPCPSGVLQRKISRNRSTAQVSNRGKIGPRVPVGIACTVPCTMYGGWGRGPAPVELYYQQGRGWWPPLPGCGRRAKVVSVLPSLLKVHASVTPGFSALPLVLLPTSTTPSSPFPCPHPPSQQDLGT